MSHNKTDEIFNKSCQDKDHRSPRIAFEFKLNELRSRAARIDGLKYRLKKRTNITSNQLAEYMTRLDEMVKKLLIK